MSNQNSKVSIVKAGPEDKAVVANLVQLYLYDMTGDLPLLIGFALVVNGNPVTSTPDCFFMAEFFVLKAYRNKGVGAAAFEQILRVHAGSWQIA